MYHNQTTFKINNTRTIMVLAGDTNTKYLNDNGVRIWDEWADDDGNLGSIYGYQWRSWPLQMVIILIKFHKLLMILNQIQTAED